MGSIFTIIAGLGGLLNGIYINTRIALYAILFCLFHFWITVYLMSKNFIDVETGRMLIEFLLGTLVFVLLGLVFNRRNSRRKKECDVTDSKT